MSEEKAEELNQKGRALLEEEKLEEALEVLQEAQRISYSPAVTNNLATVYFLRGEVEKTLQILEPNLSSTAPYNPYAHGLAVQALAALNKKEEAYQQLEEAVADFEVGIAEYFYDTPIPDFWKEYTVIILRAAGALREHRKVLELFNRWKKYHIMWECSYLGGVAAFNMKRFAQAAKFWSSGKNGGKFSYALQRIAFLAERGTIPPFELEYELPSPSKLQSLVEKASTSDEHDKELSKRGIIRIHFLSLVLESEAEEDLVDFALEKLIVNGEKWGQELGEELLASGSFSMTVKFGAAKALTKLGVYKENEPIRVNVDGREQEIVIKSMEIVEEHDEKLEKVMKSARKLQKKRRYGKAIDLLNKLYVEEGKIYPPAFLLQANLHFQNNEPEECRKLLEIMNDVIPDNVTILFNLTFICLELDDVENARAFFHRAKEIAADQEVSQELRDKLPLMEEQLSIAEEEGSSETEKKFKSPEVVKEMFSDFLEKKRQRIEEKTIPADATLVRGLKNMPAVWLDGMCYDWGLEPARTRKERERQIASYLLEYDNLRRLVEELEEEELEILKFLLEKGGWSKIGVISRKFGTMDGDGFYWHENLPRSPLGYLWSQGIVFVGKTNIKGQRCKIVSLPMELREKLSGLL